MARGSKNPFARTRDDHALETAADYAELILRLTETEGEARAVRIAQILGVSPVTVSKTVQRLQRDGLLVAKPYRSLFLTPEGEALAIKFREKHAVVVEFLIRLGVPSVVAETDAEGIEHHVSELTLEAFRKFIGAGRPHQVDVAGRAKG
ncbi:MAG: manganese-binding transcriptional regulator MntR [Fimbriimonadaceae bacterium]|nr:manganese-binding transcriptional regulator MntR [Fimbriimonadaceae bacterium]